MKIIKRGEIPEEKVYRHTCRTCKTVFECTKGEGKMNYGNQRDPGDFITINCPVCHGDCIIYVE